MFFTQVDLSEEEALLTQKIGMSRNKNQPDSSLDPELR
jgi:hypothetical protein